MQQNYLSTPDFLNMVLQTRGPQATPYAENVKYCVRDHLTELQKVFPTLGIKINDFHANDGQCQNLLNADGTIPIHYQGVKYNIPIKVWLLERYPYTAPLVYVMPTPNMIIKGGHKYVDRNGQPPLYSAPAGATQRPPPPPRPPPQPGYAPDYGQGSAAPSQQYSQTPAFGPPAHATTTGSFTNQYNDASAGAMPWGAMFAGSAFPAAAAAGAAAASGYSDDTRRNSETTGAGAAGGQVAAAASGDSAMSKEEIEMGFRNVAVEALAIQLVAAEQAFKQHSWQRSNELLEVQRTLTDKRSQLQSQVDTLKRELSSTEGVVQEMSAKSHQLRMWLERNEPKVAAAAGSSGAAIPSEGSLENDDAVLAAIPNIDVQAAVTAADDLTRQHLQAQAEDLAIEDAILTLDSALAASSSGLTLDSYIKKERDLARRQFFARAMSIQTGEALKAAQAAKPTSPSHGPGGMHPNPPPPPPADYRSNWQR